MNATQRLIEAAKLMSEVTAEYMNRDAFGRDHEKAWNDLDEAAIAAAKEEQGKVLTDEEIDRLCLSDNSPITPRDVRYGNRQEAARLALRYARDNGYLAPAKGNDDYTTLLVNALRMSDADQKRLVKDLAERGVRLPAKEEQGKVEPVAWTTQIAIDCAKANAGTVLGGFDGSPVNLWGDKGIPLYTHPAPAKGSGLTVEGVMDCMDGVGDPPENADLFYLWAEKFRKALEDLAGNSSGNLRTDPWISVGDRLPEDDHDVLVTFKGWDDQYTFRTGSYSNKHDEWCDWNGEEMDVTHWMPLPAPPDNTDADGA